METTSKDPSPSEFATPLATHGLNPSGAVHWNLDWKELHDMAVERGEASLTTHGVLLATTGERTGRSPNDRFIVQESGLADDVWWGEVNKSTSSEIFDRLLVKVQNHLDSRDVLFVKDAHCGADPKYSMPVRLITEKAWHASFFHNMFVRSEPSELVNHVPEYTILHAPELMANPKADGTNSGVFVILALDRGLVIIGGTHYAGEIKKAIFTIMNHILPAKGLLPMHCSANTDYNHSALFFGLSGTGKTTLSADPGRALIGDDEHGWSDDGVFNFEGGCYAKLIGLSKEDEPAIFATTRMPGSVLENVILDANGVPNFEDGTLTQNTRGSYPIESIENRTLDSMAGHPKDVVFLTCDAFGVLPPLSRLTPEQAAYHFISGYTAKVAGTEAGVTEPQTTFSACFGAPFMPLHPTKYAEILGDKMQEHNVNVWLINTGWSGGVYGVGERISLKYTRAMITAILNGELKDADYTKHEVFGLNMPTACPNVPSEILSPKNTWGNKDAYDAKANELADAFNKNFAQFADNANAEILDAAPKSTIRS